VSKKKERKQSTAAKYILYRPVYGWTGKPKLNSIVTVNTFSITLNAAKYNK